MGRWHHEYGNTFKMRLGRTLVQTIEPKNVQAILAHKFKDFELGSRNDALRPLLGEGIFASDGTVWEQSRALLRPNFVRNQISDIAVYEKHVSQLIKSIPADGSTVDLQDLFFRMVCPNDALILSRSILGLLRNRLLIQRQSSSLGKALTH